jgi:hypothetical protein
LNFEPPPDHHLTRVVRDHLAIVNMTQETLAILNTYCDKIPPRLAVIIC